MPTVLALDRVLRQTVGAFGRYELLGRLGAGGMAEVFVARCGDVEGMQSLVAVKRILPHLADDEGFVALFRREAQISLRLRHRAIARVFEVGRVDAAWFLAMELVPGESLSHLLRAEKEHGTPVDPRLVAWVGAEIASALHHAHGLMDGASPLEVIHRDVSPQNLLLGFDGAPKLIDFGVARCVRLSNATRTGTVRGKLSYASPEQLGARRLDGRSDLFSLGVVLHEWLSGASLFGRDSDAATVQAVEAGNIPHIPAAPALSAVLARALERNPESRFADGEAMADALLHAVGGRPPSPERLVAAHLAARFPDRKRRWEAITAGGEVKLSEVVASRESRSSTVRHSPKTSSPTFATAPTFPGEPTQSSPDARASSQPRRRAGVAFATIAAVAGLAVAGMVGNGVWRRDQHERRLQAVVPATALLTRSTSSASAAAAGAIILGDTTPSMGMPGASVSAPGASAASGGSIATVEPPSREPPSASGRSASAEAPRHVSRRRQHRGGSSVAPERPARPSHLRRTVVDELEPSPYQVPQSPSQ